MSLIWVVLVPFLLAPLALAADRFGRNAVALIAGAAPLAALAVLATAMPSVLSGSIPAFRAAWLPFIGLEFHLRLDGLALMFALLVAGIGALVVLYGRFYLAAEDPFGRFFAFLLLFMGSMLGVVLAGNILLIGIFWELTSISSFLLIGYWHRESSARQGARMALAVTGLGGLALLGGLVLLGQIAGGTSLDVVLAAGDRIAASPLYVPMLLLVFLGAATKSAQFPFHFWLPHAMAAPTPVSAYLHSATMVKAGVFLLARLHPALSGHEAWFWLVGGTGMLTAALAAWWAIGRHDLKALLAYSTIAHLGIITALFGFGSPQAAMAGVLHIFNHAVFKAALFMTAGIIDHETGTRDLRRLGGLRSTMPRTAIFAVLAGMAMAGLPPLGGFISKELFFETAIAASSHGGPAGAFVWIAFAAGLFGIAYSLRMIWGAFFGVPRDPSIHAHEPPWPMRLPVELLALTALLLGLWPGFVEPLIARAAGAVTGAPVGPLHLGLWHGFNLPLALSFGALVGGTLLYLSWPKTAAMVAALLPPVQAKAVYDALVHGAVRSGQTIIPRLRGDRLRHYALMAVLPATAALALPLIGGVTAGEGATNPADPVAFVAWLLLVAAALTVVRWYRQRLAAVVAASVVGLVVSLTFARLSAPDLALTQLSVEVVSIVLLLLALNVLPDEVRPEPRAGRRMRDAVLAVSLGGATAWVVWAILTRPFETISGYYIQNSVSGGGGTNVVNVTLVDFRGFDTLGEISVVGMAALGVYALLYTVRPRRPPRRRRALDRHPIVLAAITQALLPVALVVGLYLFLRGHNAPGGGFIAGLVMTVAFLTQYIAGGTEWARSRLRLPFAPMIGFGVGIALLTGLASFAFERPFLTSAFTYLKWPVVGKFEVASAALFDLGVLSVVIGGSLLILTQIGRISRHDPDANDAARRERNPWKP